MNPPTATLTILLGLMAAFVPIGAPALTFEERWEPVRQLPPMIDRSPQHPVHTFEQRWAGEPMPPASGLAARENPVKIFRVTRQVEGMIPGATPILPAEFVPAKFVQIERQQVATAGNIAPLPPERPKARTIRKAELDICQRHNMRKVHYGRTWRCRK